MVKTCLVAKFLDFFFAFAVWFDYISALELKQKSFRFVIEHSLVDIMHLVSLYQAHNIQVVSQLFLSLTEYLAAPLCLWESVWAPFLAARQPSEEYDHSVLHLKLKLLAIHNQFVEEEKLVPARLLVDVAALAPISDKSLHLFAL